MPQVPQGGSELETATVLSLVPATLAIAVAVLTRQVLFALFLGVLSGAGVLLVQGLQQGLGLGVALSNANPLTAFLFPAIGSEDFAKILLIYLWCLGGLIGLWERTGGARHFATTLGARMVRGPRTALLFSWIVGVVFHQGGTISTVLAGTTVKPVADRNRVSHEELAYVVDSTASPVATVLPFNAWPQYVASVAAVAAIPPIATGQDVITFFFESVPYNFYGIFAVFGTLLFALGLLPWIGGRMALARRRARETGVLDHADAEPMMRKTEAATVAGGYRPSLWDFFVPLGTLLALAIVPFTLMQLGVIENGNWINEAFCMAILAGMATAWLRGMSLREVVEAFVSGCEAMTIGALILALAVTLGMVAKVLGTGAYVVALLGDALPYWTLPGCLTLACMVIAFATGSSWGTFAVVFPVAMPLAWAVQPDAGYLSVCFGAVLGGAVFGDQCSPISDTTVLSSMFTGCDLMDHVKTQIPLALAAALLGIAASTLCVL